MGTIQLSWAFGRALRIYSVHGEVDAHLLSSWASMTPSSGTGSLHLWDFTCGALRFGPDEGGRELQHGRGGSEAMSIIRTALVCPNELDYGLFRLVHACAPPGHYPRRFRAFRCMRAANRWLGSCRLCRDITPPDLKCVHQCPDSA